MEQNQPTQNTSLFGLSIDPAAKSHLSAAASWARFLAIMGFIMCGLLVLVGIFAGTILENMTFTRYERFEGSPEVNTRGLGAVAAIMYSLVALLYFFPFLFLFHFASKMKTALLSNDQDVLTSSFHNLKKTFRYVGVLMIIGLCLAAISILIQLAGNAGR